ncbi:monocarboxylate transporter 3 isoform X2 [Macaca fascicularis]|uniref:monocarboxylate transporter 3 isoform X2 n=1 Tax=Macaca fascicularis TaxID=9541 RepID=UPI001E259AE6|nr:monocarboxylate transporter 3 isoform X3 [Macaca fascicularis]
MGAGGPRRGEGPPDGGWGWVVLGACFVVTGFAYGFPKAVSVFFRALMRDFGAGYSDTAWVSSIMLAMLYGTGPVSSILVTRFGCRPVMLAGGLLASAGMILASFATRLLELYLTAGVLTGRLVDALKNYEIIFYLAGSEVALAGVFMAVATNCCLRCAKAAPAGPGTEGGASDTEDAEAEGDSEPLPVVAEEPGNLEALEVLSAQGEPTEPETEARPRLAAESV